MKGEDQKLGPGDYISDIFTKTKRLMKRNYLIQMH